MKKTSIVTIILVVLVLISAVQAFQLSGLKTKIADGKMELKTTSVSKPVAASSDGGQKAAASLPSSVKNLPQMVGGC